MALFVSTHLVPTPGVNIEFLYEVLSFMACLINKVSLSLRVSIWVLQTIKNVKNNLISIRTINMRLKFNWCVIKALSFHVVETLAVDCAIISNPLMFPFYYVI